MRRQPRPLFACLLALAALAGLLAPGAAGAAPVPAKARGKRLERYPATFRLAVRQAIDHAVARLRRQQAPDGRWGRPDQDQPMGRTALPLLALLKGGAPADDPQVRRAFHLLRGMPMQHVYGVALYLMAIQAAYQPTLDLLDTDVDVARRKRVKPEEVRGHLAPEDAKAVADGLAFLLRAQNASGLWHYDAKPGGGSAHDLSNSQYGLLGLRAAVDCGFPVAPETWLAAYRALLTHQDSDGKGTDLLGHRVQDGYVFDVRVRAASRGFHYTNYKDNGPLGKHTVWVQPATGSMTTAGVACLTICQEGLWRSRRFRGADRKKLQAAIRDGLVWMQVHFSVSENPGEPHALHHLYYLYGLERMGMLSGTRWIGQHDWYKEGADLLLEMQDAYRGGWGGPVRSSFAILFLKRATRAADRVVVTGR